MKSFKKIKLSLEMEILELEQLLKEKQEQKEMGDFIQSKKPHTRDGMYSVINNFPDFESKWMNSFYVKHYKIVESFGNATLSPDKQNLYKQIHKSNPFKTNNSFSYHSYVLHCQMVIPSEDGPILKLEDPMGYIFSDPLKNTSLETAITWVGKMLVVDIGHHFNNDNHPINRIQVLKHCLYDSEK